MDLSKYNPRFERFKGRLENWEVRNLETGEVVAHLMSAQHAVQWIASHIDDGVVYTFVCAGFEEHFEEQPKVEIEQKGDSFPSLGARTFVVGSTKYRNVLFDPFSPKATEWAKARKNARINAAHAYDPKTHLRICEQYQVVSGEGPCEGCTPYDWQAV